MYLSLGIDKPMYVPYLVGTRAAEVWYVSA